MSSWSMNDGSALTGTMTFTNGNAAVSGSGTNFDPEVKVGDIIISAGGVKHRVKAVTSDTALTLTENFSGSTENGVAATVTRPPLNFASAAPHIDNNVLGITSGESLGGVDNITSIGVGNTTLGTYERIGGNTYHTSAPTVTIAAPTARTITQANINETTNVFTVTGHNMRTGTKLTYTSNGTNIVHSGGTLADSTAVFVIRVDEDTFKIASSLSNAQAGTALDITNDGNDSNSFVGDTATATATVSGGVVTGITVTAVGSDYQSAPAVTVEVPKMTIPTSAVNAGTNVITFAGHGLSDTDQITYNQVGGGTLMTNVTDGQTVFVRDKTDDTFKIAATSGGTAINIGTGHNAQTFTIVTDAVQGTAVANLGLGVDGDDDRREIAHTGWVKRTVGTGGRAGRVHYETLVAASSITGDAEDIATPDS